KWFDKSPHNSEAENIADLRQSLAAAADAYTSDSQRRSAFRHHATHGPALQRAAEQRGSNALTAGFGASLVDRAVLDALCRHAGDSETDIRRIVRVAAILDRIAEPYHVTLDGNEQFGTVDQAIACWRSIVACDALDRFASSTLWIEQPLPRELATRASVAALA